MNLATIITFTYGILSIVGGIIGYKQAGSKISLISGAISGLLLIIAGILQTLYECICNCVISARQTLTFKSCLRFSAANELCNSILLLSIFSISCCNLL